MNKIITLAVSLVLMLTILIVSNADFYRYAGKGNGKNIKISSPEELVTVLDSAIYWLSDSDFGVLSAPATDERLEVAATAGTTAESSTRPGLIKLEATRDSFLNSGIAYSGMTIKEESYMDQTQRMRILLGGQTVTANIQSAAVSTIYLTENAVFITLDADIRISMSTDGKGETVAIGAVMNIYADKDDIYLMMEEFSVSGGDLAISAMSYTRNQWLDLRSDEYAALESVVELLHELCLGSTEDTLTYYSEYFTENMDAHFDRNGNKYTMKDEYYVDFVREVPVNDYFDEFGYTDLITSDELKDISGSFSVNLGKKDSPRIKQQLSAEYRDETSYWMASSGVKYTFTNIGNTVIEKPQNVQSTEDAED